MQKMKLKIKRLKLQPNVLPNIAVDDPFLEAKDERDEEKALFHLLSIYEKNKKEVPKNTWLNINEYLPPNTNEYICCWDTYINGPVTFMSYVFLQQYLLAKYFHGFKVRTLMKYITHFMVIKI